VVGSGTAIAFIRGMSGRWKLILLVVAAAGAWRFGMVRRVDFHSLARSGANLASGRTTSDLQHRAQHDLLRRRLRNAIDQYRSATGDNPTSLSDLVRQGVLESSDRHDEWDHELQLETDGQQVLVRGAGPDGHRGTSDDWTLRF